MPVTVVSYVFYSFEVQGGFFKMSYFGVKHGLLRAFLGKKRDFRRFLKKKPFFGSTHVISGHFGSKKANFDHF